MQVCLVSRRLRDIVQELDTELKKPVIYREITAAELKQLADDFPCLLGVACMFNFYEQQEDSIDEAVEYLVDKHSGLKELKITNARLGNKGWSNIQNLGCLEVFNVPESNITDARLLQILKNCPNLIQLDLKCTKISGEGITAAPLHQLKELNLEYCRIF